MNILDIPKPLIDLITKLNCHEFSMGETIPTDVASELITEIEDYSLWAIDACTQENVVSGSIELMDFHEVLSELSNILVELEDESIDRLSSTVKYRELYNHLIEMIFSEKTFDELNEDEVEYLNFIPTTNGWILPVCFRIIYDDNLIVYHRYTDEEKKFGDIGYNDHDGILFDYYYKIREV